METFFYVGVVKRPFSKKNAKYESFGAYTTKDIQ
jgi:hypothetical protein